MQLPLLSARRFAKPAQWDLTVATAAMTVGPYTFYAPSHTGGGASGPDGEGCHRPGILTPGLDGVQGYTLPPVPVCSMHEKMGYVLFGGKGALHGIF